MSVALSSPGHQPIMFVGGGVQAVQGPMIQLAPLLPELTPPLTTMFAPPTWSFRSTSVREYGPPDHERCVPETLERIAIFVVSPQAGPPPFSMTVPPLFKTS